MRWHPDYCTSSPGCEIDVTANWSSGTYVRRCAHHQALKDGGLTDAQVFAATVASSRVKESARAALLVHLSLTDPPRFVVGSDGNFSLSSGVSGLALVTAQGVVATALVGVSQPVGTSTLAVVT